MNARVPAPSGHVPVGSFEDRYRAEGDPWRFASSEYEQRRYDLTVALLPRRRYGRAFEPGCSIGELTARLAHRADAVLAMDASPTAVARARQRCRDWTHVRVDVGELPDAWPGGTFDLVVLSEVGYYFTPRHCAGLIERSAASLTPGGTLLAVHWRGHSEDHVLTGDEVHGIARASAPGVGLRWAAAYVEDDFRADVWAQDAA